MIGRPEGTAGTEVLAGTPSSAVFREHDPKERFDTAAWGLYFAVQSPRRSGVFSRVLCTVIYRVP